jgi:hypothetical protein
MKIAALSLLTATLALAACDDGRSPIINDARWLTLDGGGPRGPDTSAPTPDKGVVQGPEKGKFCNKVSSSSGGSLTMTLKVGGVDLTSRTGECSPCRPLTVGTLPVYIYVNSQYAGAVQTIVKKDHQYVYWAWLQSSRLALDKEEIAPGSQETCESFMPQ